MLVRRWPSVFPVLILVAAVASICDCSLQFKIEELFKPSVCQRPSAYGDQVFIYYNGTKFDTGEVFDRSQPTKPYRFQLGVGDVIEGFEEGLVNMCPGERRRLVIPPHMAYGMKGGGTPQTPGGTVVFEVEMVHAEQGPRHPDVFKAVDMDSDSYISKFELIHYIRKELEGEEGHAYTQAEETEMAKEIFLLEDLDKDGYISLTEFSGNKHDEF